jgi:hypothetical protein
MDPPAAAGPLRPTAPAVSPPIEDVPVPLNVVAPPAVPLEDCANAKVLDSANAEANAIVVSFMTDPFLLP